MSSCQDGEDTGAKPAANTATAAEKTVDENRLSPFGRDVARICHSEERSGALERPEHERPLIVAQWLGAEIKTQEGRDFLAQFARSRPAEKAAMLERTARRFGLVSCPLVKAWSGDG